MKDFCLFSLIATVPASAFAMENLTCAFSGVYNPYEVSFESKNSTATVYKDTQDVEFGNLSCSEANRRYGLVAQCSSQGVWDGGFSANLYRYDQDGGGDFFMLELYEVSFVGSKLIETFPCWIKKQI